MEERMNGGKEERKIQNPKSKTPSTINHQPSPVPPFPHSPILPFVFLCISTLLSPAFARTTFEEFEARRSPELARQACALARWAAECHLKGKQPAKPSLELDRIFTRRAGVFVTICRNGKPRGCWGTIEPQQKDIAREIAENAVGAATADLRQKPPAPHELEQVTFQVSVIGPLRPVRSKSELAPDVLGLLVRNGPRAGMLLPGEAKTADWQVKECKRKAGLPENTRVQMYVFRTVVLEEKRVR